MLYHLLLPLREHFGVFNVFQYLTFRSAFAALTALVVSLALGPPLIRWLRRLSVGEEIRDVGPAHQDKAGTPTMGGLLILVGVFVPTLLWSDLSNTYVWLTLLSCGSFGLIGFLDDFLKVQRRNSQGLSARHFEAVVERLLEGDGVGGSA